MKNLYVKLPQSIVQNAILFILCLTAFQSFSQNYNEVIKAVASDRKTDDLFGGSVAISGSFAIIGAPSEGGEDVGAAYIYEINEVGNWEEKQKLVASDANWFDIFGKAVAISGNYAVVGAEWSDRDASGDNYLNQAGAAYVFKRGADGTWYETQKIVPSDRAEGDQFGGAAFLVDSLLMISAPKSAEEIDGVLRHNIGSTYVFELNASGAWIEKQKLIPPNDDTRSFGVSISISNDRAIIGFAGTFYTKGFAVVYEQDASGTWIETSLIQSSDQTETDQFGLAVSIFEDYAVVGARFNEEGLAGQDTIVQAGAAYVFKRDNMGNWNEIQKLLPSERDTGALFGTAVSIHEDKILIGALLQEGAIVDGIKTHAGSAYLFEKNGMDEWSEIQKIDASDRYGQAEFGNAVFLSKHSAIIGANLETRDASGGNPEYNAGAAYIYSSCTPTIGFDAHVENDSLTWIDGITYYSDNQTAVYTLPNAAGCDSIVFLDLIINNDNGQLFLETAEQISAAPYSHENLGQSVAISGTYAISGIRSSTDENGNNFLDRAGAAYLYERNVLGNWEQLQKIVASDRAVLANFGQSVAMDDDYAVIGAPYANVSNESGELINNAGAVYIFKKGANGVWNEIQKLTAIDKGENDLFGSSVSISGDHIIIGVPADGEDITGNNFLDRAGSAYVFKRDNNETWNEVQKVVASDRDEIDRFGTQVAISNNYIIVSATGEDEDASGGNSFNDAGSVYIFEQNAAGIWSQVQKVVASDRSPQTQFGRAIAIIGNRFVVGAPYDLKDENGIDYLTWAGSVYIFEREVAGTWNQVQKIVPTDRETYDRFGSALSISDEFIVIGTPYKDKEQSNIENSGVSYVFRNTAAGAWEQLQKIVPEDLFSDRFGSSVAIYENYIVAGAPKKNGTVNGIPVNSIGKVNFFEICSSFIPTVVDSHMACNSFTWIDGNTYYSSNNTASFTAVNSIGCVTNVLLNLTINAAPSYAAVAPDTTVCFDGSMININGVGNDLIWYDDAGLSSVVSIGNTLNTGQSSPGTYTYFATDSISGCPRQIIDTVIVTINALPDIDLGNDLGVCISESITLNAGDFETYLWNTGETNASISVNASGIFGVTVTDANGCQNSDDVGVSANALPFINLGNDTTICASESLMINAGTFDGYLWNTAETSSGILVNTAGDFSVTVTDVNGCQSSDNISVTVDALPIVDLGNDTTICALESLTISAGSFENYEWSTGETTQVIVANVAADYEVIVRDANGCENSDVINLEVNDLPEIDFGNTTAFCVSDSLIINGGVFENYLWSTGEMTQNILVNTPGDYQLTVTDANNCQNSNSVNINTYELPFVNLGNDTSLCAFDLLDAGDFSEYLWNTGETSQAIMVNASGNYLVTVTDDNGCQNIDDINLMIATIDVSVDQVDNTLIANQTGTNYQWIDCSTNAILPGETNQSFLTNSDGSYAVVIDDGICVDTSECFTVINTSASGNILLEEHLSYYPNPTSGNFILEFEHIQKNSIIKLLAVTGQSIQSWNMLDSKIITLEIEAAAGVYFIEVTDQNLQKTILKIIKQ